MRRPSTTPFATFIMTALLILLPASAALAHAERQSSDPKEGKTLDEPPMHLYINFSEPPTGDSKISVTDGCGDGVVDSFEVTDRTIHANLLTGQPGRYNVTTQVISGLDGHEVSDEWSFDVSGTKDCSAAPPTADDDGDQGGESEGFGSVALLAAGGAVVLIGVAAAIRLRSK